jgi:hypothetical protein
MNRGCPVAEAFAHFAAMMILKPAFARRVMPEARGGTLKGVKERPFVRL